MYTGKNVEGVDGGNNGKTGSRYDAEKLRNYIKMGYNENQLCELFEVKKTTMTNYINKLRNEDDHFYKVPEGEGKVAGGKHNPDPKVGQNGCVIEMPFVKFLEAQIGDNLHIEQIEDGEGKRLIITKIKSNE
jgi:hypothetical protein